MDEQISQGRLRPEAPRRSPPEIFNDEDYIYTKAGFSGVLITRRHDPDFAFYLDVTHITQIRQVRLSNGEMATSIRHNDQHEQLVGKHAKGIAYMMRMVEHHRQIENADGMVSHPIPWNPIFTEDYHTIDNEERTVIRGDAIERIIGPPDAEDEQEMDDTGPTGPPGPIERDEGRQLELD